MSTTKLIDVVANLDSYDADLTIYAVKPWTCDSEVIVAREPEQGGVPHEAESCNAEYFIEVFVAKEFLEGWVASEARPTSVREQCERLIHYAVYDA
jgi:hypothetical protein